MEKKRDLIRIREISFRYEKLSVLKDLNITIQEQEIFGIVGMSGVGKTTLLNIIIGFLKPESGEIDYRINSRFINIHENIKLIRDCFGFSSQKPSFYNELTVKQNLEYFASLYNLNKETKKENIERALELVDLKDSKNKLAGELSGGMQKRLDIACSIIHKPRVLIMDEPTADLDVFNREKIWNLIRRINEVGTTIIIASHFLEELEIICSRIGILHEKRMLAVGSIEELKKVYSSAKTIHLKTKNMRYDLILEKLRKFSLFEIRRIESEPEKLVISTENVEETMRNLMTAIRELDDRIVHVSVLEPRLGDIFERIITKNKT
ncbi:MAG: ABC transporter ATP-binding protein [Candidatus Woesearchaeota archaeon]